MESFFPENLKALREKKGFTKLEMASTLGIGRSTYYGYESGESFPTFSGLLEIADFFGLSLSDLVEKKISETHLTDKNDTEKSAKGAYLITHPSAHLISEEPIKSFKSNDLGALKMNVFDFETKAAAGSAITLLSKDKYRAKPNLYLPGLGPGIHIRNPIGGDSMHSTIKDGDKVVSTLVTSIHDIRQGYIHTILDASDGVVCKRVYLDGDYLELVSDNEIYKPIKRHLSEILCLFRVREVHTTDLRPYWSDLRKEIREIKSDMADFRRMLKAK